MKRILFIFTAFVLLLSGCGKDADLVIGMWEGSDNEMEAVEKMVDGFEADTGKTVDIRLYSDYYTELNTELQGGTAPDAFYVEGPTLPKFLDSDALVPLNSYLTDEELADYIPSVITNLQDDDGETYALPKDWATDVLYCNEDLLKQAGTSCDQVPTDFKDWPDFLTATQKNMPDGTNVFVANSSIDLMYEYFALSDVPFMKSDTETQFSAPELVKIGQTYFEEFGGLDGVKFASELGYSRSDNAFTTQEAALVLEGTWSTSNFASDLPDTDIKILEMPAINGKHVLPAYITGWGVNANSENQDLAIEFAKYASTDGAVIVCSELGYLPGSFSVVDQVGAKAIGPNYDAVKNVYEDLVPNKFGNIQTTVNDVWGSQIPLVVTGDTTVEESFKEIDEQIAKYDEQFTEDGSEPKGE